VFEAISTIVHLPINVKKETRHSYCNNSSITQSSYPRPGEVVRLVGTPIGLVNGLLLKFKVANDNQIWKDT